MHPFHTYEYSSMHVLKILSPFSHLQDSRGSPLAVLGGGSGTSWWPPQQYSGLVRGTATTAARKPMPIAQAYTSNSESKLNLNHPF